MTLDYLEHYGTPRHSGRYPWGSGKNPQRNKNFATRRSELKKQGLSDKEIATAMGLTMRQYRAKISNTNAELRAADRAKAVQLYDKYTNEHNGDRYGATSYVAREMGKSESSIRKLLDNDLNERSQAAKITADTLKSQIDKNHYLDVGEGSNLLLGVSTTKLDNAVAQLEDQGYAKHTIQIDQLGTGKKTTVKVLAPPGTEWAEVASHKDRIGVINGYTPDEGQTLLGIKPPVSVDSSRVAVNYDSPRDGVVQIRRGVDDVSLGKSAYGQVRIAVDGTHYIKGMAMYGDDKDFPPGVDLVFNTNKKEGTPMMGPDKNNTVLKLIKRNPDGSIKEDNPFGATIKAQHEYDGKDGKKHQSVLNMVNEEGDWSEWSKSLSSQFLSKQSDKMAEQQLGIARKRKRSELDEIEALTNPVVKRKLLDSYADDTDSAAVKLKAAAFPRSGMHVLLPAPSIKPNEIYAPSYKNGEKLALVRYPHAGKFEIPELTVNNNNREARRNIGAARDAVGIHPKVAQKLSGADFDGDTVMVIPITSRSKVLSQPSLKGLRTFDPKSYKIRPEDGLPDVGPKSGFRKQLQMGSVSNLITDMTLRGAAPEELERAVKHSMVVIDAEKHNLNWRQSEIDNGISELKTKYQGGAKRGASTLISKASSEKRVPIRKELTNPKKMNAQQLADWKAGKKVWEETPDYYYKKNPKTGKPEKHERMTKSTKMYEADNAYDLINDKSKMTPMEKIYADYANSLKSYANESRRESRKLEMPKYSKSAKEAYAAEVASLNSKVKKAMAQKPLERQAQIIAGESVRKAIRENPDMEKDEKKRLRNQALDGARKRVGKKSYTIDVTPKEWEAIQAHAVSSTTVKKILDSADMEQIKKYATPRKEHTVSSSTASRIKAMMSSGKYTQAEVAEQLGVSVSTVSNVTKS